MSRPSFVVLACVWSALRGLALVRPVGSALLRGFVLFGFAFCGVRHLDSPSFSLRPPTAGTR